MTGMGDGIVGEYEKKILEMNAKEILDNYEKIREMALRDSLTGLLNRGAMERAIEERLQNMSSVDSCALFIVDLDNFKSVNDSHGHQMGDKVLIEAAEMLSGMFRESDIVGRLGGDEFAVFISGRVTEKLVRKKGRQICEQLQFVLGINSAKEVVVTASVGIHLASGVRKFDTLYRLADTALYDVKKSGKQSFSIKVNETKDEPDPPEHREAVHALKLKVLLDCIDSGVALIEVKDPITFVYVNAAFRRMLSRDAEELNGQTAEDIIFPEDRETFRSILRVQTENGIDNTSHVLRVNRKEDGIRWWKLHAAYVEESGTSKIVLVTAVDISDLKEREADSSETERGLSAPEEEEFAVEKKEMSVLLPEGLRSTICLQMRGNLSKDCLLAYWSSEDEESGSTCTEVMDRELRKAVSAKAGQVGNGFLSREELLLICKERKKQWMTYEYRRLNKDGVPEWVSCTIYLYAEQKEVCFVLWISREEKRHLWERQLGSRVYKDPISRLYTRATVREMAVNLIGKPSHRMCALVMLEIKGMAKLYEKYAAEMDERWKAVIVSCLLAAGSDCIPGQFGAERYLLFFPEIENEDTLKRKLEQMITFVKKFNSHIMEDSSIRFLAGGVCRYRYEADYRNMMREVQSLCQHWSNSTGDQVIFSDEDSEEGICHLHMLLDTDDLKIQKEGRGRKFTGKEKDAVLDAVTGMLDAESLSEASGSVLRVLGEYYKADRAYILVPVVKKHILTMPHEWTSPGKRSIQHLISGIPVDKLPLIDRCRREEKSLLLTRVTCDGEEEVRWSLSVYPMESEDQIQGYLCLENTEEEIPDTALQEKISRHLLKERKKYIANANLVVGSDTGIVNIDLPNYNCYMEDIYTFHSEKYSSLGVVCVDIPELFAINGSRSFRYGRKLLWYVIQVLADVFGSASMYRTWDSEFVVLYPDVSREIFFGKCARLRATLAGRYPKEVRVGCTWSDKIFTGKALVDEARTLMQCEKVLDTKAMVKAVSPFESMGKLIQDERIGVYFRPRIDRASGQLTGVAAVIRRVDEKGNLVAERALSKELEKNGLIRDMDLFVLDEVMKAMDLWRKKERKACPVFLVFSKETILHPSILASMLAIQSRYPELKQSMIQFVLRGNVEDKERYRLDQVLNLFREYGLTQMRGLLDEYSENTRQYYFEKPLSEKEFRDKYLAC